MPMRKGGKPAPRGIEDDPIKLQRLSELLNEYSAYIGSRERQPLAGQLIDLVGLWVSENLRELPEEDPHE